MINNKKYIGQSINVEARFIQHQSALRNDRHMNYHLQNAWKKYGQDNFKMYLIKSCQQQYLNRFEKLYIRIYDSFKNGYNLTLGGDASSQRIEDLNRRAIKYSLKKNRIGVMHVSKFTDKGYKQGFRYRFQSSVTGQHLYSYDLLQLKKKVQDNNYDWIIINEDLYQQSLSENKRLREKYDR